LLCRQPLARGRAPLSFVPKPTRSVLAKTVLKYSSGKVTLKLFKDVAHLNILNRADVVVRCLRGDASVPLVN
jgi:hypothetical protein